MKNFSDMTEREVLAVEISFAEEDSRIYMTFAEDLKDRYPDTATIWPRRNAAIGTVCSKRTRNASASICGRFGARTKRAAAIQSEPNALEKKSQAEDAQWDKERERLEAAASTRRGRRRARKTALTVAKS